MLKRSFRATWLPDVLKSLIKACQGKEFVEELDFICDFYKEVLQKDLLHVQLQTLHVDFKSKFEELYGTCVSEATCITIFDIKEYFRDLLDQPSL